MEQVSGPYSDTELASIYELGRMYFEMGYFAAAERIFSGLCSVDDGKTPARVGLGLVKIERGLYSEALNQFKSALQRNVFPIQAKLGLSAAFIAMGELARAKSTLVQVAGDMEALNEHSSPLQKLWEVFAKRVDEG